MFESGDIMKSKRQSESGIQTIRDLIDHRANTQPDVVFLISPETGCFLTFRGLQEQSRFVSIQLQQLRLERGDKVAFLMDNGLFTAQLFLGTMYGGFVSVPLNVRAGVSQLSYTLDHCDAKVVFVEEKYADLIKDVLAGVPRAVRVIPAEVDSFVAECVAPPPIAPPPVPASEDVALLMYTSGSTGQPKAAVHSHRTILAQARNSVASHQLAPTDRSLLVLPLYHINAECVTLIPTLMSGGSVAVPHQFVVRQFWDWMDEHRCTWSALVPTIVSQLLDWKDPRADSREAAFKRIRFLRSSSAPLSPSLHREFLDKFRLPLIQAMGSSEAGNIFSNPVPPGTNKIGSPGLPWGFEARIVNREGTELPAGEPGEVLIRGAALMQGYYKDPAGTAAVLNPDGWFYTGDLACRDKDGYFFVVGRSKELIIKGGVNIAPKQIDEVLESHPAVLEAAAVGVPDRYVGEDVVAFVVLRSEKTSDERELLGFCETRLGQFKTPTRIHFVSDLPKGPSGKIQRLKLQEKAVQPAAAVRGSSGSESAACSNGQASQTYVEAAPTPIEQTITTAWAELLKQPQVDVQSNFFALGGDSLLAIQCVSRVREKLPVNLSLSDFFQHPTIAAQATLIRQRLCPNNGAPAESGVAWEKALLQQLGPRAVEEAIPPRNRSLPCPLSPAQERLWFMEQLNSGVPVYNESEAVRLVGKLDIEAMELALNAIIARHEILRSTIRVIGGQPVAVAHESWPLEFKRIDLGAMSASEREAEVQRLLVSEPRRPYDLESSPGIRTTLVRLGPEEHVFILMMHHIICDWSSEGVLWRELSAFYRALLRGEPLNLPPLPIQHGDYAAWQKQQMAEGAFADDLAYWEENLRGAPGLLELPTDRPRPVAITYRGTRKRFQIGSMLVQALRDCSRREKISLFTFFTAALDTLLYRYTGSEDVLVGLPLADRDRPELQSVIGFLLHVHALRTRLSGDMTFRELLARVQKGVLDLYSHCSPPFDQVVSRVQPERNPSYTPLFQVMINWRDRDQQLSFIGMDGLEVESLLAETGTSKFDLTLMLTDDGDDISLEMEYNTDIFDDARIVRMVGHYQTLLEAVADEPNRRLAELPMLTDAEHQQLLIDWNQTAVGYPKDRCVHELVEEQAEHTAEAVAAVFESTQLTYRQLNDRANQLAHHLQKLGVGPDTLVGICLERSVEMVVGLLGILKAGGAYVPLDPGYPKERLAFMVNDSGAPVLLTHQGLRDQLQVENPNCQILCLDADWGTISRSPTRNPISGVSPENLAYVLYTSGSTGRPKGVEIEHRALTNFLCSMAQEPGLSETDVLLAVTTLAFDIAGLELFLPLITGARIELASRETAQDGAALARTLSSSGATTMQATPATWRLLFESGWKGDRSLRVLCGGEAMDRDLAARLISTCGSVWNMYGPTETTIWSSVARIESDELTIGRPIANTQMYVLDGNREPMPIGIVGELWIGGEGIARGYLGRPELTAEKFVQNPFGKGRLYKTGDLARYRSDGAIELLGRIDSQVKIRGFRIELGEIETVLRQHPSVQESIVIAREDIPGDKRLVAYLVVRDHTPGDKRLTRHAVNRNGAANPSELREFLRAKLPDYMVPGTFVTLEALPLTPNRKVDRKALPRPEFEAVADESKFVAPSTPTEIVLARIWCEVLGLKHVGIHDNFFESGGHSLLAVRIFSEIEKEFGDRPPLATLFQAPTIEKLAAFLDDRSWKRSLSPLVAIRPSGLRPPFFAVHGGYGEVIFYSELAACLGKDQPFYALRAEGRKLCLTRDTSIEGIASYYLQEIRQVQAHGPYFLGGYCIGGVIAFEMAQQLRAAGEEVALLVLFDSHNPEQPVRLSSIGKRIRLALDESSGLPPSEKRRYIALRIAAMLKRKAGNVQEVTCNLLELLHKTRKPDGENAYGGLWPLEMPVRITLRRATAKYRPRGYPGRIVLLRAIAPDGHECADDRGWTEVAEGGLEIHDIPGKHTTIFERPHVQAGAERLAACIQAALSR
jgi:amino acid adenylation domain-containing protein